MESNQLNDFEPHRFQEAQQHMLASNGSDSFINAKPEMFPRKAVLYEIKASPLSEGSSDRDVRSSNAS